MQMAAKVVYYGPGLCGKTTNLQFIFNKTSPKSRGEMVSLETESDRTLFFDLLPLEVGIVSGFKTRFQLYTVPGQVFYGETRKMVLKGVDGVVFVADSQEALRDANKASLEDLKKNLSDLGLNWKTLPLVLQYNKRDLSNILSVKKLGEDLNFCQWPSFEATAINGKGVFETLKGISRLTLQSLRESLSGGASTARVQAKTQKRKPSPPPKAASNASPTQPPSDSKEMTFDTRRPGKTPDEKLARKTPKMKRVAVSSPRLIDEQLEQLQAEVMKEKPSDEKPRLRKVRDLNPLLDQLVRTGRSRSLLWRVPLTDEAKSLELKAFMDGEELAAYNLTNSSLEALLDGESITLRLRRRTT